MRLSETFTKTRKNIAADEVSRNAQLLIRAGYIHKEMAGSYCYLPFGIMVLENIKEIVRSELNAIGGQELLMTVLQRQELWEKTDRWDDEKVDVWFKTRLQNDHTLGLGWSHEEPIVDMLREHISSYKDLPVHVYQFQNKMRNELRAKSGIMRGREFVMKDGYTVSADAQQHQKIYDEIIEAYHRIFERLGIGDITYFTFASGGAFTQFSHEFQTICEAGEDEIYLDQTKKLGINEEVYTPEVLKSLGVEQSQLVKKRTAEVGNIFSFGSIKCEQLDLKYTDETGQEVYPHLGSYGIGVSRLMGVLPEIFSDQHGLVWPKSIAPFRVHLVRIGDSEAVVKAADEAYKKINAQGHSVLYDDRDERTGAKLADADLIGVPTRVIISEKTVEKGSQIEVKERDSTATQLMSLGDLLSEL